MGLFQTIATEVVSVYNLFLAVMPPWVGAFLNLLLLVLFIVVFAIFIWKFYRFVATKNLIELNLNQYNTSEHPAAAKLFAGFFYFIEYIIILPFLIFFWYAVFALFLIFLTENPNLERLIMLAAIIIAAIRMTAYYSEDLSKDLAKLLPFTLLGVSLINSITKDSLFSFESIIVQLGQIPTYFGQIALFLIFIIGLEIILRFFDFVFSLFGLDSTPVPEPVQ